MPAPASICILRLSALGDATHVVPLVHTLRDAWPDVRITWIVGKVEAKLVGDLAGVEFVVFDKRAGLAGWRAVAAALRGRRFDVLLHCQVALRANLLSALVRAGRRVGYDPARAKDLHGLFVRERIPARRGEHALDAIGSFCEPLGLRQTRVRWDLPVSDADEAAARALLPGDQPTLLVNPCSSHLLRNWRPERYAAVADHAIARHGLRVAICGGRTELERRTADAILAAMKHPAVDLVGRDTLKQFLALARRAVALLTPDSGPMHMANAMGTPVIGLHAASNPARSGPYSSRAWCVDRYDEAARRFRGVPANALPWGAKIEVPGVMDLVETGATIERLDALLAARPPR
ncbi:MAG: glycosyltransferase family 9 protein [Xanthomonadaceae bacterium]|jgi:heptosyltransferase I|nr:glycosyltransferase family 9 protein [Xanthomonadaceae bacterium]